MPVTKLFVTVTNSDCGSDSQRQLVDIDRSRHAGRHYRR